VTLYVKSGGSGPELVLLHGWGLHGGVWAPVREALEQRFHVNAFDLPGHGFSAFTPLRGFDAAVDEIAAQVPEGAIVCGWSLGGLLAQALARRHPLRVRALALVSTTPCFVEQPDWPHAMKVGTLAGFALGLRTDIDATLKAFVALNAAGGAQMRTAMRALAGELLSRGAPDPSALDMGLELLRTTDLRAETAGIEQPAVVIHGRRDALAPIEAGRWLASRLPRARMVELEEAAHLPFLSHAREFVAALDTLRG
jgi:pimeloyl-[acyl-carrier protein] methyl ester esterase